MGKMQIEEDVNIEEKIDEERNKLLAQNKSSIFFFKIRSSCNILNFHEMEGRPQNQKVS